MLELSIIEIATLMGGKVMAPKHLQSLLINQVIIDSRQQFNKDSTLFIALNGPRNNGHSYIAGLLGRELKAFVVSQSDVITTDAAFIVVDNTLSAFQKLASRYRVRFNYPVVAITGSNGKTIVKEWLYNLLSSKYRIIRSPRSYNSQAGVPLSVLLMNHFHNLGIFEAGISMPDEMINLATILKPTIGIFTNIGDAHQENFRSQEEKIHEKLKLFHCSEQLVYCVDDEKTNEIIGNFCSIHDIKPVSWSLKKSNCHIHFHIEKLNEKTIISATDGIRNHHFNIPFTDGSSIENACHCFSVIWAMDLSDSIQASLFEKLEPVSMRLEIKKGRNNCLLINDYYNSDITSLSIALSVLHQNAVKEAQKKIIVLSDIHETGQPASLLHQNINTLLKLWEIDELIGIGPVISAHADVFSLKKSFYSTTEAFLKESQHFGFSNSVILLKGARIFTFEKISDSFQQKTHQTVLEINLNALLHNLNTYKRILRPETKIMAMVKAFSYGSGDIDIARFLQFQNIDYLAVAVADEGMELRHAGIHTPIVVMNPQENSFFSMIDYQLEPNIYNSEILFKFEKAVMQSAKSQFPVHLKLDTGMNRLGFKTDDEVDKLINHVLQKDTLKIVSVFSHLAASDDPSFDSFTLQQIELFTSWCSKISDMLPYKVIRHLLNSAGIERFPDYQMEMVRLGIGLYGIAATSIPVQNISTFKSIVSQIKKVYPGESVGYSRRGIAASPMKIAVVPVGYADGIDRRLGNRVGEAIINDKKVQIIGNVCMDMLMVDVTGTDVVPGDEVELFGSKLSLTSVAQNAGTIPYEILTGISQRVKRIYLYD